MEFLAEATNLIFLVGQVKARHKCAHAMGLSFLNALHKLC